MLDSSLTVILEVRVYNRVIVVQRL